jgi:hypothetical protein
MKALEQNVSAASFVVDVTKDNAKRVPFRSHAVGQPMSVATGNIHLALHEESILSKHGLLHSAMEDYSYQNSLGGLYNDQ